MFANSLKKGRIYYDEFEECPVIYLGKHEGNYHTEYGFKFLTEEMEWEEMVDDGYIEDWIVEHGLISNI